MNVCGRSLFLRKPFFLSFVDGLRRVNLNSERFSLVHDKVWRYVERNLTPDGYCMQCATLIRTSKSATTERIVVHILSHNTDLNKELDSAMKGFLTQHGNRMWTCSLCTKILKLDNSQIRYHFLRRHLGDPNAM